MSHNELPTAGVTGLLKTLRVGGGGLVRTPGGLRFVNPPLDGTHYCNAQIDDYQGLPRRAFLHRPPLRLTLRARFSHTAGVLKGTGGFGFWNDPFLMTGLRTPALPRALWFFYAAPPSDMRLAVATPGYGWKAAVLDALSVRGLAALPLAALAAPLMRHVRLYRRLWPFFARSFRIAEQALGELPATALTAWHTYTIEWGTRTAIFSVDDTAVLTAPAPQGPLGLVIWLDNQYLAVHPSGRLRYGLVAKSEVQWLEIADLSLASSSGRIVPGALNRAH
jgi:hypothetical protein